MTGTPQANTYAMIQRRARAAGIRTRIGNPTVRATGITAYLKNDGTIEKAAMIANHAKPHDPVVRPAQRRGQLG